jgi:hypothetical protein
VFPGKIKTNLLGLLGVEGKNGDFCHNQALIMPNPISAYWSIPKNTKT